ncbi:PAQR family membrane homeostasis protein TrhA [Fructobacillus parabroussonetiae]|uniref:Hemolysin III n=1 Tax=Fructobacillus parabroussonetiae TaxID=2713174 RepID=A0ABS5QUR0_9LACO|nr:hemolysin III family protein [Fructobacillus parabroussonetiae]MBS9336885.1 hemolysin III [Fructobacillus parabroussonetiae]MCK8617507.1 hemolysin III family protein [Fructobacillus parabroussonetiae]
MKKRTKAYQIVYEVLNAATHGLGFVLALIAACFLIVKLSKHDMTPIEIGAISIYLLSISLFLLASTLFHALVFTRAAKIFQFMDHAGIYLVILGSYTPYTWLVLGGTVGWSIWIAILLMACAGLVYDIFFVGRWPWVAVTIYLVMGWLIILVMPVMWSSLTPSAFWLLLAGGVVYSLGTIFYLVPAIPMGHVYWHLFVIAGAGLMYFSIYQTI